MKVRQAASAADRIGGQVVIFKFVREIREAVEKGIHLDCADFCTQ